MSDNSPVKPDSIRGEVETLPPPKKHTAQEDGHLLIAPETQATRTISTWDDWGKIDALGIRDELKAQIEEIAKGNMSRPEAMLLSQAHTLDALFNELARKAHIQEHMPHYEAFLRLAFKAQGQCRATLETLADIKSPRVIFTKQANISHGHQQINNNIPSQASHAHAEETKKQQNELLTELPHETLDSGRTDATIPINSQLEAVDKGRG